MASNDGSCINSSAVSGAGLKCANEAVNPLEIGDPEKSLSQEAVH
jgi:hypothetical protein